MIIIIKLSSGCNMRTPNAMKFGSKNKSGCSDRTRTEEPIFENF